MLRMVTVTTDKNIPDWKEGSHIGSPVLRNMGQWEVEKVQPCESDILIKGVITSWKGFEKGSTAGQMLAQTSGKELQTKSDMPENSPARLSPIRNENINTLKSNQVATMGRDDNGLGYMILSRPDGTVFGKVFEMGKGGREVSIRNLTLDGFQECKFEGFTASEIKTLFKDVRIEVNPYSIDIAPSGRGGGGGESTLNNDPYDDGNDERGKSFLACLDRLNARDKKKRSQHLSQEQTRSDLLSLATYGGRRGEESTANAQKEPPYQRGFDVSSFASSQRPKNTESSSALLEKFTSQVLERLKGDEANPQDFKTPPFQRDGSSFVDNTRQKQVLTNEGTDVRRFNLPTNTVLTAKKKSPSELYERAKAITEYNEQKKALETQTKIFEKVEEIVASKLIEISWTKLSKLLLGAGKVVAKGGGVLLELAMPEMLSDKDVLQWTPIREGGKTIAFETEINGTVMRIDRSSDDRHIVREVVSPQPSASVPTSEEKAKDDLSKLLHMPGGSGTMISEGGQREAGFSNEKIELKSQPPPSCLEGVRNQGAKFESSGNFSLHNSTFDGRVLASGRARAGIGSGGKSGYLEVSGSSDGHWNASAGLSVKF
ncbi:MAG: hypothetical protein K1000chlam4_00234 [Chlamydiae bacterium]|nr:hypothetical protein [Chlamydiota bacterium]